MNFDEIRELVLSSGQPEYRAQQLYSGINSGKELNSINIPKDLRNYLIKNDFSLGGVEIFEKYISKIDGTIKYLYKLEDGNIIEGVLMKYKYGNTLCVSTQVGCRMGCAFCASTIGGLVRNLNPGEILGQVIAANKDNRTEDSRGVTNIVLMGSGEPLDNYDNVFKFLSLVSAEKGLNISMRNISVSTCGIVPKIKELAKEKLGITLSLSLHSPDDEMRKTIMPISKAYRLDETARDIIFTLCDHFKYISVATSDYNKDKFFDEVFSEKGVAVLTPSEKGKEPVLYISGNMPKRKRTYDMSGNVKIYTPDKKVITPALCEAVIKGKFGDDCDMKAEFLRLNFKVI